MKRKPDVEKAAALAASGRYPEAMAVLLPKAAERLPKSLSDFYTFVGEDDLLSENPLLGRLKPAELAASRRALAGLPRGTPGRAALLAYVLLCAGRWAEAADAGGPPLLNAAALWLRGDHERTKRWVPAARREAERATAAGAPGRDALLLRAQIRFEFDDHEGSLADLDAVLALDPSDDRTRVGKVDKLLDMGCFADAMRESRVLLRRHPRAWWAYAQRGRIHGLAGRPAAALPDFERALRLAPRSGALLTWKCEALRKLGRLEEARRHLERAKRLAPKYSLTWEHSGRLRLVEGDAAAARRDLDRACRLDPVRSLSFAWRGEAAFKLGRYAEAWADFETAAPLEPRTTWNAAGRAAAPAERERAFWADLDAAVARGGPWPLLLRGRFRASMGREREALADLTVAAAESAPRAVRARALAWRGWAALRLGATARALADLDAALALDPRDARAGAWRAEALLRLGRESEALTQFDASLRRPVRALGGAYLARAALHERGGRAAAARRDYETAFTLDGTCEPARAALWRLGAVA